MANDKAYKEMLIQQYHEQKNPWAKFTKCVVDDIRRIVNKPRYSIEDVVGETRIDTKGLPFNK